MHIIDTCNNTISMQLVPLDQREIVGHQELWERREKKDW
jgi:hypothetical protein